MPYGAEGDAKFPNVIADINADDQLSFVVHDGDFKNGSSLCSDEVFFNRLDLFNQFEQPFVYIPGDNEWTDCHRENNGSYDPLERLAFLRTLFFPTNQSLGLQTMTLERQSVDPQFTLYRENVRWVERNVMFVGLHVVGSNNNFGRTPTADAEYAARNAANLAWLNDSFARAAARGNRAVMVILQANPNFELPATDPARAGFNDSLAALQAATIAFAGPVVLVHGDSHYFRIDKPMIGTAQRPAGREFHPRRDVRRAGQSLASRDGEAQRSERLRVRSANRHGELDSSVAVFPGSVQLSLERQLDEGLAHGPSDGGPVTAV